MTPQNIEKSLDELKALQVDEWIYKHLGVLDEKEMHVAINSLSDSNLIPRNKFGVDATIMIPWLVISCVVTEYYRKRIEDRRNALIEMGVDLTAW